MAVNRCEVIVDARVVGGLQMVDQGEADDKIIAVLAEDYLWGSARDLSDVPQVLVQRLRHYFSTYKLVPGETPRSRVYQPYGREQAFRVLEAARADYAEAYGSEQP